MTISQDICNYITNVLLCPLQRYVADLLLPQYFTVITVIISVNNMTSDFGIELLVG